MPPPGVQILSISCSFWENSAKLYVGASLPPLGSWRPLLGEILDPALLVLRFNNLSMEKEIFPSERNIGKSDGIQIHATEL